MATTDLSDIGLYGLAVSGSERVILCDDLFR